MFLCKYMISLQIGVGVLCRYCDVRHGHAVRARMGQVSRRDELIYVWSIGVWPVTWRLV